MSAAAVKDEIEFEAIWSRFEDNGMAHRVWPAGRAGEITTAPKAHVDKPKWWTDGIVPILEDVRVYMLHRKGSQKKAKSCWAFVCQELASNVFVPPEAEEAFT